MTRVDANLDEDVQASDASRIDRYQTAVPIVDEHVAAKCACSIVIDAACAVGDIGEYDCLCVCMELDEVRDGSPKHGQPLWHLQGYPLYPVLSDLPDCLLDFKVVVFR